MIFYDEVQAKKACEEDPSLIFELIKQNQFEIVEELVTNRKVNINTYDQAGNDIMCRLLKAKQHDLVLKLMSKRNWDVNHQNLDGNTFGHILAKDNSIYSLKIVEKLTKNKKYIPNIKNNKGETVLDRAINSNYIYTALKILEDKKFNNIDVISFKNLCNAYIKNAYYGKYSKINNLEIILESLDKKEDLLPSMEKLLSDIKKNLDLIKYDIMKNNSKVLESVINSSVEATK